jgi:hypothetical protein
MVISTQHADRRADDLAATQASLGHEAVTAALRATVRLTGMELAYVAELTPDEFRLFRTYPAQNWTAVTQGSTFDRAATLCHKMLAGAPNASADLSAEPSYAGVGFVSQFGLGSYVGVPVERPHGGVFGTLCGIDRGHVAVPPPVVDGLRDLAGVIGAHLPRSGDGDLSVSPGPLIRRQGHTWIVENGTGGHEEAEDLTSAMVLADLLAADLGLLDARAPRPPRIAADSDGSDRLEVAIQQLEHALAARVTVEQAIGVLAERRHLAPRAAFEALRSVARGSGRRVHDLAREVVSSTTTQAPHGPAPSAGAVRPGSRPAMPGPSGGHARPVPTPSAVARRIRPMAPQEGSAPPAG